MLHGGQFHRQGLVSLPMEYRNITKPSSRISACVMQYHGELYPLSMPCTVVEDRNMNPDDADIIS